VVQLYIGDPVAGRSRPVRELKDFRKVALAPGETKRVGFRVTVEQLRYVRADRLAAPKPVWEPGRFVVELGPSSEHLAAVEIEWRADE
jgi:beta-glucosidase